MRIIAATRVRNEEDVIEALVRHHARLVEAHLLLDNASTDRTPDILRALREEGLKLRLLEDRTAYFAETQQNTALYRLACTAFGADWVVFLDADEFLDTRGIAGLADFLAAVPGDVASVGMQLRNYEAGGDAAAGELNVLRRLTRRTVLSTDIWKVMVRGRADPGEVVVDAGNHHVYLHGAYQAPLRQDAVVLAHYPNRSPLHWAGKAAAGRLKVLAAGEQERRLDRSEHYTRFCADFKADPRGWIARADGAAAARADDPALADDPLPYLGDALRHTRPVDHGWRALSLALGTAEEVAAAHGRLLDAARPSPAPAAVATRRYRRASLAELAGDAGYSVNGRPMVERLEHLGPAALDTPALAFGTLDLDGPGIEQTPALGAGPAPGACPPAPAYVLREATVHGQWGIVTLADRVLEETLHHAPLHRIEGAEWQDEQHLLLPVRPLSATLPSAFHLLAGNSGNYFHWLFDALTRFDADVMQRLGPGPEAQGGPVLLLAQLDQFWKWESIGLLVPPGVPRIAVAADGMLFAQRLVYVPGLIGDGFLPHPALGAVFDAMRLAAGDARTPWRRLYVARSDSRNRVLANEGEVAARAAAAGFTPVLLSAMPVAEQARLFAEASHIIAPHGAGLSNIMFCRPGTALCELHMDRYVQWSFRRLAGVRGVRYGCVIGTAIGPRQDWVHAQPWRVDPAAIDAVLAEPRFIDG